MSIPATVIIGEEGRQHVSCGDNNILKRDLMEPNPAIATEHAADEKESERAFLQDQLRIDDVTSSFLGIYRYATKLDLLIVAISTLCALVAGVVPPIASFIGAHIILAFSEAESRGSVVESLLDHYVLYYVYLLVTILVTCFVSTAGFNWTGARITRRIKLRYFAAVLKQNLALFDDNGSRDILYQLTDDTKAVQLAISFKLSQTITAIGSLLAAYVLCFTLDWLLTFELIWSLAFGLIILYFGGKLTVRYSKRNMVLSAAGSAVVNEALSSIKTTTSLGIQPYIHSQYMELIHKASQNGFFLSSINMTLMAFCVSSGYYNVALAFWQGSRRFIHHGTAFTSVLAIANITKTVAFRLLSVGANMEAFAAAIGAIQRLSRMIRRASPIDSSYDKGATPDSFDGVIEMQGVMHIYPTRPKSIALNDINITFPVGHTVALVGHSGSGKSSISSLLLRFYDPIAGRILLDGKDLASYQLRWLRQQIAIVKQESFMFNRSVFENIELGLTDARWKDASKETRQDLIHRAAEMAQASDFINQLSQGYDTIVGARGSRLSGGQLQRIAIARALVGNPRILILDEATSALDVETEAKLLSSMADQSRQRTNIVIAHRLSTIRHADKIVVLSNGSIVESGTHDDLLAAKSHYHGMIKAQDIDHDGKPAADQCHESKLEEFSPAGESDHARSIEKGQSTPMVAVTEVPEASDIEPPCSIWSTVVFLFKSNNDKNFWPLVGFICCIITGGEESASAVLFAKTITALTLPRDDSNKALSETSFYSWMFFLLASVMLVTLAIQGIAFASSSKHLSNRLRSLALQQYLRMDVSFFDKKENSPAALSQFLSDSASDIASLISTALGTILICISTLLSGIIVALALGWKMALVCIAVVPLVIGGGYYSIRILGAAEEKNMQLANHAAAYAGEALSGIQTIAALTREKSVLEEFEIILDSSQKEALIVNLKTSILYALSQAAYNACMALGFYYGGQLILRGEYTLFQAVAVQTSVLLSANSAGFCFNWTSDLSKAKHAATALQRLLARKSAIDPSSLEGGEPGTIAGEIEFNSVSFAYPSSPNKLALDNLSLRIPAGANVALVGATGSGKSTILSLIERFYDPTDGRILLDSKPIKGIRLSAYRKHVALVSQEPYLFSGTVRMNLNLGLGGQNSSYSFTDDEIKRACQDANIYDFLISLPDGFNTEVGTRGSQFSVGQKQRIVMARALLQNAKILLLDEATSALDSQSEVAVQQALETVKRGRTVITVAHRLSTIAKADKIYVLSEGRVVEAGSHVDLIQAKGLYYNLYMASKPKETW